MSDQIVSESKPIKVAEITIETKSDETKPKAERRERRKRQSKRKSDASADGKKQVYRVKGSDEGDQKNSLSRPDQMIISRKPIPTYIFVLKKLLEKHDQIDLTATGG